MSWDFMDWYQPSSHHPWHCHGFTAPVARDLTTSSHTGHRPGKFRRKKITQQEQGHISVADQSCFKKHEEYIMYVCIYVYYIYVYTYIIYYIYICMYICIYMNIIQLDLGVTILPSDPLHKPGTWGAAIEPLPCPARCPWLLQASRASNGEAMFIHGRNVSQQSPNRRSSRKDLLKWISQQDQAASYNI